MSAKKRISDRTAALLEKQRQLDERIKRSVSRDNSLVRKARNHALVQIGIAVEAKIKQQPSYAAAVRNLAIENLKPHKLEVVISYLDDLLAGESAQSATAETKTAVPPTVPQQQEQSHA